MLVQGMRVVLSQQGMIRWEDNECNPHYVMGTITSIEGSSPRYVASLPVEVTWNNGYVNCYRLIDLTECESGMTKLVRDQIHKVFEGINPDGIPRTAQNADILYVLESLGLMYECEAVFYVRDGNALSYIKAKVLHEKIRLLPWGS